MLNAPPAFTGGPRETKAPMRCKQCNGALRVIRGCRAVSVFCAQCGGRFNLEDYTEFLDEIEDFMGNIPMDRI